MLNDFRHTADSRSLRALSGIPFSPNSAGFAELKQNQSHQSTRELVDDLRDYLGGYDPATMYMGSKRYPRTNGVSGNIS